MRFRFFPSAFAGCAALSEAAGLRTIPLRRSILLAPPPEFGWPRMDFALAVFTLVFAPCVHRARLAPLGTTAHASPTGSCVAVSLWRDVPLPAFNRTLTQLGRTCLLGSPIRQRSWDSSALRSVPRRRVPAFVRHIRAALSIAAMCISAVHPHMPLSNSARPADFYGCRSHRKLNSFHKKRAS